MAREHEPSSTSPPTRILRTMMRKHAGATGTTTGFSLIELLVVVAVLAILAAIAIPAYLNQKNRAQEAVARSDVKNMVDHVASSVAGGITTISGTGSANTTLDINGTATPKNGTTVYVDTATGAWCVSKEATGSRQIFASNNVDRTVYAATEPCSPFVYRPAGGSSTPSGVSVVASGLGEYYNPGNNSSYPGSGTTVTDLSGNGNNGTLAGGVTWDSNGWFSYNGSSGYITTPYSAALSPAAATTITAWAYLPDWTSVSDVRVISRTEGGGWQIGVNNPASYPGQFGGVIMIGGVYRTIGVSTSLIPSGWHEVTLSFDGSTLKLYIDSNLQKTLSVSGVLNYVSNSTIIGAEAGGGTVAVGQYWPGRIGATLIYTRALSDTEIQQNYTALRTTYS